MHVAHALLVGMALALTGVAAATEDASPGACAARSPDHTVALVELYTSQGCSSCPPADRWLSALGERGYVPDRVVPLSLHVTYWDYLGWKDPYAQARFAGRQRKLTQAQKLAFVYTPQVLLQGRDFRAWRDAARFDAALERIGALPAQAAIALEIRSTAPGGIQLRASARLVRAASGKEAVYLAAYENRLGGPVAAGENGGRILRHDYVVLEWLGPFPLGPQGRWERVLEVPLVPRAALARSGIAAFVQDRRSLEVLQALMLPVCPGAA